MAKKNSQLLAGGAQAVARGADKQNQALIWLSRWGYSTPEILSGLLGGLHSSGGHRLTSRLVKSGMAREIIAGGDFGYWKYEKINGRRHRHGPFILTLSEYGKSRALEIDKIPGANWSRQIHGIQSIRHNLVCQQVVAEMIAECGKKLIDYVPESSSRLASAKGCKQPDCLLITNRGSRIAIEIELTPKNNSAGALDRAFFALSRLLDDNPSKQDQIVEYAVYMHPTDYHAKQYQENWRNTQIPIWTKNAKWEKTGDYIEKPVEIFRRARFLTLSDMETLKKIIFRFSKDCTEEPPRQRSLIDDL